MHKGEITGEPQQEIYVLFEGMIAVPTRRYTDARFRLRGSFWSPERALRLLEPNAPCLSQLWELAEYGQPVAVVTYLPPNYANAVHQWLQDHLVAHQRFIATSLHDMVHRIALDDRCLYLVDPDPGRQLAYGPKGRHIPAAHARLIGKVS